MKVEKEIPVATKSTPASTGAEHVLGLDALRFIAAIWVVLSHIGLTPMFDTWDRSTSLGFFIHASSGLLFSGPAAVVVFFLISGFCIHYPYVTHLPFQVFPYLARRYIRVGIPMAAAIVISDAAGFGSRAFVDAVLWSLIAELIYYSLYPLIRIFARNRSLDAIIIVSYGVSLIIVATGPGTPGYAIYGWKLNWLLGLPCWLFGLRLADFWADHSRLPTFNTSNFGIWGWRLVIWGLGSLCTALNFHSPLHYSLTLNVFSVVAYYWLVRELYRANLVKRPWPFLEWAGKWSYSVYLCHPFAAILFFTSGISLNSVHIAVWPMKVAFILLTSYVFFIAIELPAHLVARRVSRSVFLARLSRQRSPWRIKRHLELRRTPNGSSKIPH
jgi:peptidoglycan/LPS O-acetylase OafA/YrhL